MWKNRNPCAVLVGISNGMIFTTDISIYYKTVNIKLPCDPAVPLLGIYPRMESRDPNRYLHAPVRSIICNSQKVEALQISINL